ncbi:hypothetical protein Enr13x_55280 [Stieleria neptunia]|uniref:Secreted protein n=1 Tax=Stieleria neptunia TaxID=2527979 RepID=A0A518HXR4_9BACT|nr:hypothetical protein [Stieleria neptunia]QDV45649.1 hypothetical protein Enr13x_55280 [Stieleria neptunia]
MTQKHSPTRYRRRSVTAFVVAVCLAGGFTADAPANPSTVDPEKPLKSHHTIQGAEKQIQAMYAKFVEWEELVIRSTEAAKADRRFPHQQLSRIFSEVQRGIWYAEHLVAMGEPAGEDLKRKFTMLGKTMHVFAPRLVEFQRKELTVLQNQTPDRQKTMARVAELTGQGKLAEAERQVQPLLLKLLASAFYLNGSVSRPFLQEVSVPYRDIRNRLNRERRKEYQARATAKIQTYVDAVDLLKSESTRVATELEQSPTAVLADGNRGDAAAAIEYITMLWGNASAAITRSVTTAWAFSDGDVQSTAKPFQQIIEQVEATGNAAIVNVLNSAARSTPTDQLAALYPKVLRALSKLDRRLLGSLDSSVVAAAERLAAQHGPLAETVKRYSIATAEPTRWMQRYASQQIQHASRGYPLASNRLNRDGTPETTVAPAIYGPQSKRPRVLTPGVLSRPASWTVSDATSMLGMKMKDESTVRLLPTAKATIVPQDPRHYTSLPAPFPIDAYLSELHDCLLLDDSHGPLDLSAADAQSSAELQEFQNVGGRITRLTLEPFLSRFATMPDQASALVPLNRLPSIDARGAPIDKLIWRVDLEPDWVAHRMFVAVSSSSP